MSQKKSIHCEWFKKGLVKESQSAIIKAVVKGVIWIVTIVLICFVAFLSFGISPRVIVREWLQKTNLPVEWAVKRKPIETTKEQEAQVFRSESKPAFSSTEKKNANIRTSTNNPAVNAVGRSSFPKFEVEFSNGERIVTDSIKFIEYISESAIIDRRHKPEFRRKEYSYIKLKTSKENGVFLQVDIANIDELNVAGNNVVSVKTTGGKIVQGQVGGKKTDWGDGAELEISELDTRVKFVTAFVDVHSIKRISLNH